MKYRNNQIQDLKIAYIGGGSRGWAWTFMVDLALEKDLCGEIRLYDIDAEAAKCNEIIGNQISSQEGAFSKWKYKTANTYEEALKGADFVIISILPGNFDMMEVDVHTPEKLGIYQSVGDTSGPGGNIRALRTIPMFVEFAQKIKEYCPDAWIINYTNPMSLCVKTLYEVFPEIKAFGCCHEVFGTKEVLKVIVEKKLGITGVNRRDIVVNVLGINHFTWFDEASYKGIDLMPMYKEYILEHYEEGLETESEHWMNSSFTCAHRVKFDLFLRYGFIAAAGDRHLVEFLPQSEYLKDADTIASWKYRLTTVEWRKNDLKERLARSERLVEGKETMELKPSGEEGILLIKALCGLERCVSNVNMPNTALQIPNLEKNAIVETNAIFEKDHIRPIYAGPLPNELAPLIYPHIENHERIYKAATTYDIDLLVEAFAHDPLLEHRFTNEELRNLCKEMVNGTKAYLPPQWNN